MSDNRNLVYGFSELENCPNNMESIITLLDGIKQNIKNLNDDIIVYWEGEAKKLYMNRSEELLKNLDKLYEEVKRNKNKLDKSVEVHKQNENVLIQTVSDLSDADIF